MNQFILNALIFRSEITQKLNRVKGRHFVYILLDSNMVIYVGRSRNLSDRLHHHKHTKAFDSVNLYEYDNYNTCCIAEKELVKHYKPSLNKLWVKYGA